MVRFRTTFLASQALVLLLVVTSPGQTERAVELPQKEAVRLSSPDGRWTLIASPFCLQCERTLTLRNNLTGKSRLVKEYIRTLSVGWAPDSRSFFLNDEAVSNSTDAYVYSVRQTIPLNLGDAILAHDPEAKRLQGHVYFLTRRWVGSDGVFVQLCGHTDDAPARQFSRTYVVKLDGSARRTSASERAVSLNAPDCPVPHIDRATLATH